MLHEGASEKGSEVGVKNPVQRWPYQWCSLDVCKVLQQALGVVDGGVELSIGVLPLAIQILSAQRAAMAGAGNGDSGREEAQRVGGGEQSDVDNPTARDQAGAGLVRTEAAGAVRASRQAVLRWPLFFFLEEVRLTHLPLITPSGFSMGTILKM